MDEKNKKKMGRPPVDTEPVVVRMPREMLDAIDSYREMDIGNPSRPELVRRIIAKWLEVNKSL